jgi:hypothetical protein
MDGDMSRSKLWCKITNTRCIDMMDKYDEMLSQIISRYNNQGEYPRINIQKLDYTFWSNVEAELFGKISYTEKLKKLLAEGWIAEGYEPGAYTGYYITDQGRNFLSGNN